MENKHCSPREAGKARGEATASVWGAGVRDRKLGTRWPLYYSIIIETYRSCRIPRGHATRLERVRLHYSTGRRVKDSDRIY